MADDDDTEDGLNTEIDGLDQSRNFSPASSFSSFWALHEEVDSSGGARESCESLLLLTKGVMKTHSSAVLVMWKVETAVGERERRQVIIVSVREALGLLYTLICCIRSKTHLLLF